MGEGSGNDAAPWRVLAPTDRGMRRTANLDSFGVEAPQREVFEMLAEMGRRPEEVNEALREKYARYLERRNRKS